MSAITDTVGIPRTETKTEPVSYPGTVESYPGAKKLAMPAKTQEIFDCGWEQIVKTFKDCGLRPEGLGFEVSRYTLPDTRPKKGLALYWRQACHAFSGPTDPNLKEQKPHYHADGKSFYTLRINFDRTGFEETNFEVPTLPALSPAGQAGFLLSFLGLDIFYTEMASVEELSSNLPKGPVGQFLEVSLRYDPEMYMETLNELLKIRLPKIISGFEIQAAKKATENTVQQAAAPKASAAPAQSPSTR